MDHLRLHRDQIHPGLPLRRSGSSDERIGACSEEGSTVTKTLASFQSAAAAQSINTVHPGPTFDQGHLWREVISLEHLHRFIVAAKTHVFGAAVSVVLQQPERTHES